MDEFLAIIGGSAQSLLLFPGLLAAILATAAMHALWSLRVPHSRRSVVQSHAEVTIAATSCILLLALLPFPRTYWAYPIDLWSAVVLLEAPRWWSLRGMRCAPDPEIRAAAKSEAAALLNAYLLLALAIAALGQGAGSLLLPSVKAGTPALRWPGLIVWAIALPPLASLGPWHAPPLEGWLLDLRRVAHIALLVALTLPAGDQWGHLATAAGTALGFGSLTLLHLIWRGRPEPWERFQPWIALALLTWLLYMNAQALGARLR